MQLILASTSPYRRRLIEQLGVSCDMADPQIDEAPYKRRGLSADALVTELARAKADAVATHHPGSIVIGSDQAVEIAGEILGKPGTVEGAFRQLRQLAGRTHRIVTAVAVVAPSHRLDERVASRLTMRNLDDDALQRYVARDQPLDCAGAYKLESQGIALFSAIETTDATAIVGLPLIALTSMLRAVGVAIP